MPQPIKLEIIIQSFKKIENCICSLELEGDFHVKSLRGMFHALPMYQPKNVQHTANTVYLTL
jgi:hypothetical protein